MSSHQPRSNKNSHSGHHGYNIINHLPITDAHTDSCAQSGYADSTHSQLHGYGGYTQSQRHTFRSAQASKQMVYDVFGNTIAMLEEMEERELRKQGQAPLSRSDIHLPVQSEHDDKTIKRKLDAQLLLLQSQLSSCDEEIKHAVNEELKAKTLDWNSQRQARNIKHGHTDKYVGKLYEVLDKGTTEHPADFYKTPSISERDIQMSMGAYMAGGQRWSDLDSSFRSDPNKRAVMPRIRTGAGVQLGAERLLEDRPDLKTSLNKYRRTDLK